MTLSTHTSILRIIIIILLQAFIVQNTIAQNASFIKIKSGVSFPFGTFGEKADDRAYAITGFSMAMEGSWYINDKPYGPGLEIGYLVHPVDVATMAEHLIAEDVAINSLIIRSEPYRIIHITPSFNYFVSLGPAFNLHSKVGAGIAFAIYPYQLYKRDYFFVGPLWYEITSARSYTFTAILQTGLTYKLVSCLQVSADVSYQYAPLSFSFIRNDGSKSSREYQAHLLNLTLGLGWRF